MCQGQCACSGPLIVLYTSDKGSYSARRAPTHTILPNTVTPVWIGIRVVIRVRSTSVECQWYSTLGARSMHHAARCAVLHDLDTAVSGRFCRSRSARPPPPLTSRAHRGFRPHRRSLRVCCARLHFTDRACVEQARGGAPLLGAGGGRVGFAGGFFFFSRPRAAGGGRAGFG